MKNSSARRTESSLNRLKNKIRGSKNPASTLSELRPTVRQSDFLAFLKWLPTFYRNGRGIFQWQYPRRIADLRRQGVFARVDVEREIIWAGHLLARQAARINAFLEYARKFESHLTDGNPQECPSLLDKIEGQFGVSLWIVENRIAVLQLTGGIEKQKAYAAMIRDARAGNDIVSYIAFCTSHRNEETVTVPHFTSQVSSTLETARANPEIASYILFRTTNRMPRNVEEIGSLLRYEENSGVIDYYDTFIRLAKWAVVEGPGSVRKQFLSELSALAQVINDTRIIKLLYIGGETTGDIRSLPPLPLNAHDLLAACKFREVVDFLEHERPIVSDSPSMWLVESRARAEDGLSPRLEDDRLSTQIVNLVRLVAMRADSMDDSVNRLSKFSLNFRLLNFATSIDAFLSDELSSKPIPFKSSIGQFAFVDTPHITPEGYRQLTDPAQREAYADHMIATYGLRASIYAEIGGLTNKVPA